MSNSLDNYAKLYLLSLSWDKLRALAKEQRVVGRTRKALVFGLVPYIRERLLGGRKCSTQKH
jgi:hypothetical protein